MRVVARMGAKKMADQGEWENYRGWNNAGRIFFRFLQDDGVQGAL